MDSIPKYTCARIPAQILMDSAPNPNSSDSTLPGFQDYNTDKTANVVGNFKSHSTNSCYRQISRLWILTLSILLGVLPTFCVPPKVPSVFSAKTIIMRRRNHRCRISKALGKETCDSLGAEKWGQSHFPNSNFKLHPLWLSSPTQLFHHLQPYDLTGPPLWRDSYSPRVHLCASLSNKELCQKWVRRPTI